jgi:hypothetical protein
VKGVPYWVGVVEVGLSTGVGVAGTSALQPTIKPTASRSASLFFIARFNLNME